MSLSLFGLIRHNYYKIKNGEIKNPRFTVIIKGKAVESTSFIDHTCYSMFEIHTGMLTFSKKISDYDLETKYVDGHFNKNYYRNRNSTLNKLKIMIEREVALYNKDSHTKKGAL
jgi:hypothetical protein